MEAYALFFHKIKTIQCSKIAEKFDDGGHKDAAAFSSEELLFKSA